MDRLGRFPAASLRKYLAEALPGQGDVDFVVHFDGEYCTIEAFKPIAAETARLIRMVKGFQEEAKKSVQDTPKKDKV